MNCSQQRLYQKVTSGDQETVAYVFTYIPFLESDSPYVFKKNGLELLKGKSLKMIPKHGRTEAQNWPQDKDVIILEIA